MDDAEPYSFLVSLLYPTQHYPLSLVLSIFIYRTVKASSSLSLDTADSIDCFEGGKK